MEASAKPKLGDIMEAVRAYNVAVIEETDGVGKLMTTLKDSSEKAADLETNSAEYDVEVRSLSVVDSAMV
jgi:hypothetical protein